MKITEAKVRFDSGFFKTATVHKTSDLLDSSQGWILSLQAKAKKDDAIIESQRSAEQRVFKTVDAAVSAATSIGFSQVTVITR